MATPHQPEDPGPANPATWTPVDYDEEAPRVLRLRLVAWDVISTVTLLILLLILATETTWPVRLFGFLAHVCEGDECGAVPFGIDFYIRPLVWGGIGAAIAAAVLGPVVSLLKGWYMSFWPVLSLTLLMVASVAGFMLTTFSESYWH
ncbi:hypothetical protein [Mycobacterium sp. Lab-001]|uniref:hypothetical protein n=1 Tax=Mycobacterium sp. Lab-001 TaxID=3410136 RepID=UPI003D169FDB